MAKETMMAPAKKAYNDFCDQYEKGLGELETLQKQALEQTFGMMEKLPMMDQNPMVAVLKDAKPVQLKALTDGYAQVRKVAQDVRQQTNQWMTSAEAMVPAL